MGKHSAGPQTKPSCSGSLISKTISRSRGKILASRNSTGELPQQQFPLQIWLPAEPLTCCTTLNSPSLPQDSQPLHALGSIMWLLLYIHAVPSIAGQEVLGISTVQMLLLMPFTGQSHSSITVCLTVTSLGHTSPAFGNKSHSTAVLGRIAHMLVTGVDLFFVPNMEQHYIPYAVP